jgi:hypothetical protein
LRVIITKGWLHFTTHWNIAGYNNYVWVVCINLVNSTWRPI